MENTFSFEQIESLSKAAYDSAKELEAIGTRMVEKLAEQQFQAVNAALQTGARQIGLVSETRDYKDLVAAQVKLVSEYNEGFIDSARKTTAILSDARNALAGWMEKGVTTAVNNSKAATATFTQKAA